MFVRWKRRKLKRRLGYGQDAGFVRYAVLVESVRVGGKPRQKFVAHLGYIEERLMGVSHRAWFWRNVTATLGDLSLDGETRAVVCGKIAEAVPCPADDEVERDYKDALHREKILRARLGLPVVPTNVSNGTQT